MKKFFFQDKDSYYTLEEDLVGWYLIKYEDKSQKTSTQDQLLDSYEDAIDIAKQDFGILENYWQEETKK